MQQPISRRDVYRPSLRARVSGRELEVSGVSIDRALPDPMAGGSLTSASATFTAVEGDAVTETVATPWDPSLQWPPVPQEPVSVDMDTGAGPVSVLRGGRVVSAGGGTGGREVEIEAADAYESLNRTISWDGVSANMPSLNEGEYGRYVSMGTTSITNMILDHCGWYSTPPSPGYTMLRVPAQGSMWPDRGYIGKSMRMDKGGYPYWLPSKWGIAAADVDAEYTMAGGGYSISGRGGLELAAMTQTGGSNGTWMYLTVMSDDSAAQLCLQWSDTAVYLRYHNGSAWVNAASLLRSDGMAYGSFRYVSATRVEATLWNGGNTSSATVTVPSAVTSRGYTKARIWGRGRGGGYLVCAPSTLGTLATWEPNAVLYPRSSNRNGLQVRPPIEGENCADLLAAQCEAEAATYWIDETGVLRWWDLARLEGRSSVATLNSDDDISESGFEWSHDLSQVKSRVSVKWTDMVGAVSWRTSVTLWQGNGETLQPGDVLNDFIEVPDDEIWIMPDVNLARAGTSEHESLNHGLMSFYGGVIAGDGIYADSWAHSQGSLLMNVSRINDRVFKTWISWSNSSLPCIMKLPSEKANSFLYLSRRNTDMPIIRGKAKWTMVDQITYSAQSGNPTAPEHEIDAGWWIQDEDQAQYLADYAGERLTVPQPVLSSVNLIPFPGLQLGDVVELTDTAITRLNIRGIVIEDSRSIDSDMGMDHAITVRPTHISRNGVTYEMWGSVVRGSTYNQWGTRRSGDTYQQWGTYPLAGEAVY